MNSADLGRDLAEFIGDDPIVVLRGHGVVSVGATVQEAVSRALALDVLSRIAVMVRNVGGSDLPSISPGDLALLPDLGDSFNFDLIWRHRMALLDLAGLAGL